MISSNVSQSVAIIRKRIQRRALAVAVGIVAIHLWMDLVYRAWVGKFGWNDAGLAESFTQITAILGIACVMVWIEHRPKIIEPPPFVFFAAVPVIAMAGYELLQIWLPATFDVQDLLYCAVGGVINILMLRYFVLKTPSQSIGQ